MIPEYKALQSTHYCELNSTMGMTKFSFSAVTMTRDHRVNLMNSVIQINYKKISLCYNKNLLV